MGVGKGRKDMDGRRVHWKVEGGGVDGEKIRKEVLGRKKEGGELRKCK